MTLDSPPAETRPDPSAWERAQTLSDLGRYADASAAVAEVISTQPREAQAWCLMARVQLGLERPAGALQAARTAAGLAPESEQPHRIMSLALSVLGRHREATEAATDATRCDPLSWETHARLAHSLAAQPERLEDAGHAAEQALALAPADPGPHLAVGTVALAAGRRQDATSAFCAALGVDPQCAEAHSQLALLGADEPRASALPRLRAPRLRFGRGDRLAS